MINPNEIRIGNWYNHNGNWNGNNHTGPFQWEQRDWYNEACSMLELDDVDPIAITEEWLMKLGFEKDGFNGYGLDIKRFPDEYRKLYFQGDYLYLREGKDADRSKDDLVVLWNKDLMKKWYVHQIQNLVHALTGKEI